MSGCFGRWRGRKRSGRCKRVGQGWEALSARSHRAPLTALGFTVAWCRKLATPLASLRCCFEHSSPLPTAAVAAQQERSPNGVLITLREPPSPGPKMEHRPRGKESEERSLRVDGRPGQRHPSSHTGQIGGDKKTGADRGEDRLVCSQSSHDETVVARCAQFETILPLALKSRPATGRRREREGPRWPRAVWPSPATCPKNSTGPRGGRR
jgi:hypothetical protein